MQHDPDTTGKAEKSPIVIFVEHATKLDGSLNARLHWRTRAAHVKAQRATVRFMLWSHRDTIATLAKPLRVTLIRVGPRLLDDDNLAGVFKAVRDEVAHVAGVDDGDTAAVRWFYEQRIATISKGLSRIDRTIAIANCYRFQIAIAGA